MNHPSNPLTLPQKQSRRDRNLNMRLSESERAAVDRLAERQGVTASELARHFLLQAVAYYSRKVQGGTAHDQADT
jgi:transposase-like protein